MEDLLVKLHNAGIHCADLKELEKVASFVQVEVLRAQLEELDNLLIGKTPSIQINVIKQRRVELERQLKPYEDGSVEIKEVSGE